MFNIHSFLHLQSWWPLLKGGPQELFCLWSFTQELPALIWGYKLVLFVWIDWGTWLPSSWHWGWGDISFQWCCAGKPEPCARWASCGSLYPHSGAQVCVLRGSSAELSQQLFLLHFIIFQFSPRKIYLSSNYCVCFTFCSLNFLHFFL